MIKDQGTSLVGFSAGTRRFTESYLRNDPVVRVQLRSVKLNGSIPSDILREVYLIIKAKNGNNFCKNILLERFTKTIKFWSNQYINKYLPWNDEFYYDLINVGYLIVSKRIDAVEIKDILKKERVYREKTKKTWFQNNTGQWIRSYIKCRASKLKNEYSSKNCSLNIFDCQESCEKTQNLRKKLFYRDSTIILEKCKETDPENKKISEEEENSKKINLNLALKTLNEKQRYIIEHLYLNGSSEENHSNKIKKLSSKLGVSDKRIYFIHSQALKKLKNTLTILKKEQCHLQRGRDVQQI